MYLTKEILRTHGRAIEWVGSITDTNALSDSPKPFEIAASRLEIDEDANRAHLRTHWLAVKWCHEQSFSKSQLTEHTERIFPTNKDVFCSKTCTRVILVLPQIRPLADIVQFKEFYLFRLHVWCTGKNMLKFGVCWPWDIFFFGELENQLIFSFGLASFPPIHQIPFHTTAFHTPICLDASHRIHSRADAQIDNDTRIHRKQYGRRRRPFYCYRSASYDYCGSLTIYRIVHSAPAGLTLLAHSVRSPGVVLTR